MGRWRISFYIISGANGVTAVGPEGGNLDRLTGNSIHQRKEYILGNGDRKGYREGTHLFTSERNIKAGE